MGGGAQRVHEASNLDVAIGEPLVNLPLSPELSPELLSLRLDVGEPLLFLCQVRLQGRGVIAHVGEFLRSKETLRANKGNVMV